MPVRQRRGRCAIKNALAVAAKASEPTPTANDTKAAGSEDRTRPDTAAGAHRRAIDGTLSPVLGVAPGRGTGAREFDRGLAGGLVFGERAFGRCEYLARACNANQCQALNIRREKVNSRIKGFHHLPGATAV